MRRGPAEFAVRCDAGLGAGGEQLSVYDSFVTFSVKF
jgi:hypothetical protein